MGASLDQEDFDKEYERLHQELKDIEEQQRKYRYLQRTILEEEKNREKQITHTITIYKEMSYMWEKDFGAKNKSYLFEESLSVLKQIQSDRTELIGNHDDVWSRQMQKLCQREEDCRKQLMELKRDL